MTLSPNDQSFLVVGIEGPAFKVGPRCANPFCPRWAEHAHHLWRRSLLKGDYRWVELPTGERFGNLIGLCPDCHDRVTGRVGGHKNAIRLEVTDHGSAFYWAAVSGPEYAPEFELLAPIDPQPPTPDLDTPDTSAEPESDSCPTCGQQRRRRRPSVDPHSGEPRRRKSWTIKVPADDEDGATVLDTLIDSLAPLLGVELEGEYRYYVVVPALVFAQQNQAQLAASLAGKG